MGCVTDLSHRELEGMLGQALCALGFMTEGVAQRRTVEKLCGFTNLCENEMEMVVEFLDKANVRKFWKQYVKHLREMREKKDAADLVYDADARGP